MPLRPISAAQPVNTEVGPTAAKPSADTSHTSHAPSSRNGRGAFIEGLKQLGLRRAPTTKAFSKGAQWLHGRSLDLRGHNPEDVQESPPRSSRFLAKVKTVHLPEGLTTTPHWIEGLPRLKTLNASGFAGKTLTMRAPELKNVKVPPATQVENRASTNRKTLVRHVADNQTVATSTAIGQIYRSATKARSSKGLNGEVSFAARPQELIWCRHIAVREILDAQRLDSEKLHEAAPDESTRRADVRHALMGTRSRMKQHIDVSMEHRYREIKQCGTKNYLVSHDKWGRLITQKFAEMPKPGQATLLVESGKHAMAMFLSAKPAKRDAPGTESMEYSVRFFDPNRTFEHVRVKEVDPAKFAALGMKDLIRDPEDQVEYYATDDEFRVNGPVTCLTEVPQDAFLKQAHEPLYADSSHRSVNLHLGDDDVSHAVVHKHLSGIGMPTHTALVEAAKARPADERPAYLQSMRSACGYFDFEDAVKALLRDKQLDSSSAQRLLADLEDSAPKFLE